MLTFENARLFDGRSLLDGLVSVTVDGGKIASLGAGAAPSGGDRIDLAGKTLMPGLISCHLHPDNYKYAFADFLAGNQLGKERPPGVLMAIGVRTCRVLLESGYTGYVGAACSNDIDAQLKMAIAEGIIPGPRILACGHHVGTTGDNNDPRKWWQRFVEPGNDLFADGPDAIAKLVRDEIRRGVEVIKIFASAGHAVPGDHGRRNMSRREMAAVIDAAHERGALVRAHVCHKDLILECIELGIDIIDHGDEIDEQCIDAMAKAGSFWVPSLAFLQIGIDQGWPDPDGSTRYGYDGIRRALPLAQKAGVRILLGDDYGGEPLPHEVGAYGQELPLYGAVDGISAVDVLGWATSNAGELLARAPGMVGVVAPGASADLIVVDGNPAEDLSLFMRPTEAIRAVYRDGVLTVDRLNATAAH